MTKAKRRPWHAYGARAASYPLVLGLLVLGGRILLAWEHQALSTPPAAMELEECRRSAYLEARRQAFFNDLTHPRYYVGPGGISCLVPARPADETRACKPSRLAG